MYYFRLLVFQVQILFLSVLSDIFVDLIPHQLSISDILPEKIPNLF